MRRRNPRQAHRRRTPNHARPVLTGSRPVTSATANGETRVAPGITGESEEHADRCRADSGRAYRPGETIGAGAAPNDTAGPEPTGAAGATAPVSGPCSV